MTRCPLRPFLENPYWFGAAFHSYSLYNKGFMPEDGGFMNQPNAFLQVVQTISTAVSNGEDQKIEAIKDKKERDDKKVEDLRKMGLNIAPR